MTASPSPGWLAALLAAAGPTRARSSRARRGRSPASVDRDGLLAHTVRIERARAPVRDLQHRLPARGARPRWTALTSASGPSRPARTPTSPGGRWTPGTGPCSPRRASSTTRSRQSPARGAASRAAAGAPWCGVFARHPGARVMLWRGRFWNVWHYLLWRSLLALPAPRWLRAAGPRPARRDAGRPRPPGRGRPAALPAAVAFLAVHDAVECAAILAGRCAGAHAGPVSGRLSRAAARRRRAG